MIGQAGLPAALLTPTGPELEQARDLIGELAGGGYAATYGALGAVASGMAGEAIRALRSGDVEAAGRILRQLAAADLAACELRDRLVEQGPAEDSDPALGGLDEVVMRAQATAADTDRDPLDRARADATAHAIARTTYVLTGRQIRMEGNR
ncbi:hypothetical protein UG55_103518 [Frankia sp. EI5c]|uniref:hypothetical protein n=1 Tax=Frankia sp. EI5c TaxID=683316 RepID=UPI0007C33B03|nr:hypothetical protein [Frankia sp. EI5c]OAA23584.1 hypothetical protein UG55_103518 [Frankia sp. EI5c]